MGKKKLAIIGASYLQRPLVLKAIEMNLETHVFAWEDGNVVKDSADFYYPISITEKDQILKKCRDLKVEGITSIASDVAMPTVNYVATKLGLVGNSLEASRKSTDKFEMRNALTNAGLGCPKFKLFEVDNFADESFFSFPVIVKPTDKSGARGVTKIEEPQKLNFAISKAIENSIGKKAIVEEFIEGREFSVEMISFKGEHFELAITDKVTTGAPFFVEKEHHQPADINPDLKKRIFEITKKGLSALEITDGASHSEVLLTKTGELYIVEIAGRMGGDFIGSDMVFLSTGYDFVKGVIEISLNEFDPTSIPKPLKKEYSGVYYTFAKSGKIKSIMDNSSNNECIVKAIPLKKVGDTIESEIDDSNKRSGVIVYHNKTKRLSIDPETVLEIHTI